MKKKIIALLVLLSILCSVGLSHAEFDFFKLGDSYIRKYVDCSNIEPLPFSYSGTEQNECTFWFMFSDGNQLISVALDNQCYVYAFIEDDELLSALFHMTASFREIESQLPEGYILQYIIQYTDDERAYITSDTMSKYYSWINQI